MKEVEAGKEGGGCGQSVQSRVQGEMVGCLGIMLFFLIFFFHTFNQLVHLCFLPILSFLYIPLLVFSFIYLFNYLSISLYRATYLPTDLLYQRTYCQLHVSYLFPHQSIYLPTLNILTHLFCTCLSVHIVTITHLVKKGGGGGIIMPSARGLGLTRRHSRFTHVRKTSVSETVTKKECTCLRRS